ncbi:helix-turn-helix transcriptional regulator [Proteus terrae]|uniref:helix-turn-helix transcriptional regulator n=1 Tax=Proteus terrae TaxID=1574161 RepID=UPI00288961C1|nr:WYL domain-containing protein [Proteus terrae]
MSLSQHRHDRLAQRLAFIITQLFKGETLSLTALAHEFNVSVRTLQRDFNERLIYLDLEYKDGCYGLAKSQRLFRTDKDILQFASMTSMVPFFPSLDRKLISVLLDTEEAPPYLIYHEAPQHSPSLFGAFAVLTQAIIDKRCIQFLYRDTTVKGIAPYKLIYFDGYWYFCGAKEKAIQVFYMKEMSDVFVTQRTFIKQKEIEHLIQQPQFITALPHFHYIKALTSPTRSSEQ